MRCGRRCAARDPLFEKLRGRHQWRIHIEDAKFNGAILYDCLNMEVRKRNEYSLRLVQISYVTIWVQAAFEIYTPNPLRVCWINDLHTDMCAKYDLEPFQYSSIITCIYGTDSGFVFSNTSIDWNDLRNLYLAYCLV